MLLDSNIIIYSINPTSPKQKRAQEFIQDNIENIVVAHQNINEALRVLTHPKFPFPMLPTKALKAVTNITDRIEIISPTLTSILTTLDLIKKYKVKGDKIFDTYLVATMLTNGITEIATDNVKDFSVFNEVKVVNPFK